MYGPPEDSRETFEVAKGVTRTNESDWDKVPADAEVAIGARV